MTSTFHDNNLGENVVSDKDGKRIEQVLKLVGSLKALKGRKLTYLNTEYYDVVRLSGLLYKTILFDLTDAVLESDRKKATKIIAIINTAIFELTDLRKLRELQSALNSLADYYHGLEENSEE